jgi:hypothetical protein
MPSVVPFPPACRAARVSSPVNPFRTAVTTPEGAYLPEPQKVRFGMAGVFVTVIPGLFLGAMISKTLASFLEEQDLFVPSDDDDDD